MQVFRLGFNWNVNSPHLSSVCEPADQLGGVFRAQRVFSSIIPPSQEGCRSEGTCGYEAVGLSVQDMDDGSSGFDFTRLVASL